jgi:hypothetical protein
MNFNLKYTIKKPNIAIFGFPCHPFGIILFYYLPAQHHLQIKRGLCEFFANIYFVEHTRHEFAQLLITHGGFHQQIKQPGSIGQLLQFGAQAQFGAQDAIDGFVIGLHARRGEII